MFCAVPLVATAVTQQIEPAPTIVDHMNGEATCDRTSRLRSRHLRKGTPPPPAVERTPKPWQFTSVSNNAKGR